MKKRPFHGLRRLNLDKALGCIKVVLAAFIDDADIGVGCGFFVGDNAVDLVQFQRCWIAAVVNADGEGRACLASFHGYSSKYLLRLNSLKARARARRWSAPRSGIALGRGDR